MREDFEIYKFMRNGQQWYGFKVDYIGVYSAPSEEKIKEIRAKVKKKVKAKLDWIEKENQKYYARLAAEEDERASSLREAKEIENKVVAMLSSPQHALTAAEKRIRTEVIYSMIELGMTDEEIQSQLNVSLQSVVRSRHWYNKKNLG
jgi:methionyl-tRNA formyltransferase